MTAFVTSLIFVTLAEMGDKTQLLAMAFATRFPARTVLAAVYVATLLNHALAVAAGQLLITVIPLILFGLWTIRGDSLDGEEKRPNAYGPFVTVGVAFFLAEIGDKTQLATISLAVKYDDPMAVLFGTTTGMVIADGFGILVGATIGNRLPDAVIRLVSAGVFVVFGLIGVGAVLPAWLPPATVPIMVLGLAVVTIAAAHALFLQRRRLDAHAPDGPVPPPLPRRLSQFLFAALLVAGWAASLDLIAPLDAIDHWIGFALVAALGWKLIHEAVRLRKTPRSIGRATVGLILVLAGLTFVDIVVPGVPLPLAIGPVSILLAAVVVLLGAPGVARRTGGALAVRIAEARVTVASGLLLLGIAAQILIGHLR
jgi:putative Ca2+/H+ antiporter (TMEM165/GDT1 family)/putative Mn2+ efflux pump MntP